ncbi:MAG: N-6 DNA methylase [Chloroflexi bacterium]|nr:N-6 DNA methylase [Chloroflexota bacterium]
MMTPEEIDALLEAEAPRITRAIRVAAQRAKNEAEFRAPAGRLIEDVARKVEVELRVDRERNLLRGRADAVYNRFVIEFEPPRSITRSNTNAKNAHAIRQVKDYIESISKSERHALERIAGAVMDGEWLIFVRWIEGKWRIEEPVAVNPASVQTLLKYIVSLTTELALTPENLLRDFGENTTVARSMVSAMYQTLTQSATDKTNVLFQQWSLQFGEVCQYGDDSSKLDVRGLVEAYGIRDRRPDPLRVLFALHSYYALFIKLLAVQIAWYYTPPPKPDTPALSHVANLDGDTLAAYLEQLERGGVFAPLGVSNFLEGDFFGWYLDAWNSALENAIRRTISELAGYSLVTLDVDPDETRDLLKHLYQNLLPRELRHALGEYYTPDWLAERLLNQLGYQGQADKRILDPACGSGTFPVLEIKRFRRAADAANVAPARQLDLILHNIMGFDLNPLAVISARTNYLLALGDLIAKRK